MLCKHYPGMKPYEYKEIILFELILWASKLQSNVPYIKDTEYIFPSTSTWSKKQNVMDF